MSYFRWSVENDVSLFLELVNSDGTGVSGSDPQVMIRRYRNVNGSLLDNYYWDGSGFTATPTSASMSEVDATNQPGLYVYEFQQSLVQSGTLYNVHYFNNSNPFGFTTERHYFAVTGSSGDVKVYESEPT
jgi:hypothetical protein